MTKHSVAVTIEVSDRQSWRSWLSKNHSTSTGVYVLILKKGSEKHGITLAEAVEEALCFGWIDCCPRTLDADYFKLWLSPRKPKSVWSQINRARVENLIKQGLMTPAGLVKVDGAKKDGSWYIIDDVDALEMPDDLIAALDSRGEARKNFEAFNASYKKQILYWIKSAKRPETRVKRLEEVVSSAANNVKL